MQKRHNPKSPHHKRNTSCLSYLKASLSSRPTPTLSLTVFSACHTASSINPMQIHPHSNGPIFISRISRDLRKPMRLSISSVVPRHLVQGGRSKVSISNLRIRITRVRISFVRILRIREGSSVMLSNSDTL